MKRFGWWIGLLGGLLLCLAGCEKREVVDPVPLAPDYAQTANWFEGRGAVGSAYDVFYIVPTCVFDWEDDSGAVCHYMDVENPSHRAQVDGPLRLAEGIFADEANFYAPYYRQITIESWMENETVIQSRFEVAFADIEAAFRYYLDHLNGGRPFMLAGHSQGGKAVIELLKHTLTDEEFSRMIAAYPLGYPVRDTDRSPRLIPASDADGTGVFVTFNSVSSPDKLPPLLQGSWAAINPLNWRTDAEPGTRDQHLGMVFMNVDGTIRSEQAQVIGAYLDERTRALVVSGVDPQDYYVPSLAGLFPPGNYHVVELNFFYRNLQQNVKDRAAAFLHRSSEP